MRVELHDYQKEALERIKNEDKVILNWSRGLGSTFTIAYYILTEQIEKVYHDGILAGLEDNIRKLMELEKSMHGKQAYRSMHFTKSKITIQYASGNVTEIYNGSNVEGRDLDLVVVDGKLPPCVIPTSEQVIYTISRADKNHELVKLINSGYIVHTSSGKSKSKTTDLKEFRDITIQELIKEYQSQDKKNNTVMTRKNLLEMISIVNGITVNKVFNVGTHYPDMKKLEEKVLRLSNLS